MAVIKIGNKQSKKTVEHINSILKTINKNDISDVVGVKALETYSNIAEIKNVTITGCSFSTTKKRR